MQYWLLKSEPACYSWLDIQSDKTTVWDGVRNFQARNFMKQIQIGDLCLFYEASPTKAIVGVLEVIKTYYQDKNDENFVVVDVQYVKSLRKQVRLEQIKKDCEIEGLILTKHPRLSVMPVSESNWKRIIELSEVF